MNDEKRNKKLIKGIGIYAIGTFGTKILSFLIVPMYTYYISTTDMGIYDILISTINLLAPIITMQISDAAYRWLIQDDMIEKERYIRATMQVLIINCTLAVILVFLVDSFYAIPYCAYFCTILVLSRSFQTAQKLLRGLRKQWTFAVTGILYTIVFLSLNIILLCFLRTGVQGMLQSAVCAYAVALAAIFVLEPKFRINYLKRLDRKLILEMYHYSVPLVPNYLNWWFINSSDRYIVLFALGSSANGILAIAHKFPSMLQTILNLFNNSWQDLSVADGKEESGEYYTMVFRRYYLFTLSGLLSIIPATKIIIMAVMSSSYKCAADFVAFYYLGTVFQSFSSFFGVGYLKNNQTRKAFSTSVYGAIVNAVVNISLIFMIGLQAAAISTFLGFLIMWLMRERQNRKELMIKVRWSELWMLIIGAVTMSVCSIYADIYINGVLFLIGTVVFLSMNYKNVKQLIKLLFKKNGSDE